VVDPRRKALRISGSSGSGMISTSMPGRIVRLMGAVGDRVTMGQPVIVVEASKMENELKSPVDGIIEEILVAPGQAVEAGAKLLRVG
jgi:biotin carboxyl carrier protein